LYGLGAVVAIVVERLAIRSRRARDAAELAVVHCLQRHPLLYPERVPWVTSESPEMTAGDVVHELSGHLCGSFARLRRDVDAFVATGTACPPTSCVGAPFFSTCRAYEIELHCAPSYGLHAKPLAGRYL
jgi:hypothetical protein